MKKQSADIFPQSVVSFHFGNYRCQITKNTDLLPSQMPRFVIVHSPSHTSWAHSLATHLREEARSAFCSLEQAHVDHIMIQGTRPAMREALFSHQSIVGKKRERAAYIVTPGFWESQQVHDIRHTFGIDIPQIYCIPGGSKHAEFVGGLDARSKDMSGVCSEPISYDRYFESLRALLPSLNKICLINDPGYSYEGMNSFVTEQRSLVYHAARAAGVKVEQYFWDEEDAIDEARLRAKVSEVDAVLTLRDPLVYRHHNKLMRICIDHKKPLCASELDSVFKGAAIGYGNAGSFYSKPIIDMIVDSTLNQKPLGQMKARTFAEQQRIRFNPETLLLQGIVLSKEKRALLEMSSVFDELSVDYQVNGS